MLSLLVLLAPPELADRKQEQSSEPVEPIVVTGYLLTGDGNDGTAGKALVLTEEDLAARTALSLDDALVSVANLNVGNASQSVTIRGQDGAGALANLASTLGGAWPRITTSVDGRILGTYEARSGGIALWDVAQIAVRRGPIWSAIDRPTISGGIFLRSNDPADDPQAAVRLIAGSGDYRQLSGLANAPVSSRIPLSVRLTGDHWTNRPATRMENPADEIDRNRETRTQFRGKIALAPPDGDGVGAILTYSHVEGRIPQISGLRPPYEERLDPVAAYGVFTTNVDAVTLQLDGREDSVRWAAVASIGVTDARRLATPGLGDLETRFKDHSLAANIQWSPTASLGLTGGLRVETVEEDLTINLAAFRRGIGEFVDQKQNVVVNAQADLAVDDHLWVVGGLIAQSSRQQRQGSFAANPDAFRTDYDRTDDVILPHVTVRYAPDSAWRVEFTTGSAWHPGGVTLEPFSGENDAFEPERVWHNELALGVTPLAGVRINANLFYDRIKDAQRALLEIRLTSDGAEFPVLKMNNAPRATSWGAELEAAWRVSDRLDLQASAGLLRTRIDRALLSDDPIVGKSFQRSPRHNVSLSGRWTPGDGWLVTAGLRHRGAFFSDDENLAERIVPAVTILDARVQYQWGISEIFLYGRNLTDALDLDYIYANQLASARAGREVGLGWRLDF